MWCSVPLAVALLGALLPKAADAQVFEIKSLIRDGKLIWADPGGTGTHYTVQWSASGLTNWQSWQDAQAKLSGLGDHVEHAAVRHIDGG